MTTGTAGEGSGEVPNPAGGPDFSAALVAALGELSEVPKGQTATVKTDRATFTYSFADLATVLTYVRPILARHGLAVMQPVSSNGDTVTVTTEILHTSGERYHGDPLSMPRGQTPQQTGSAITYARRYSLLSTLGLATADDDGAAASKAPPPQPVVQQKKIGPGAKAGAERIVALLRSEERVSEETAQEAVKAAMAELNRAWVDLIRFDIQDEVLATARNWLGSREAEEAQEPPEPEQEPLL